MDSAYTVINVTIIIIIILLILFLSIIINIITAYLLLFLLSLSPFKWFTPGKKRVTPLETWYVPFLKYIDTSIPCCLNFKLKLEFLIMSVYLNLNLNLDYSTIKYLKIVINYPTNTARPRNFKPVHVYLMIA